ncbi:MAG: response regulator [Acutalibacteraceae bacterium]|nr:response regulator [Acutalibacteraceae bacterium]
MYSAIIADDEINICNGIADVLAKHCPNLNIKNVFYNGNDVLDWLKSNHTDIIITDIRMSGASGIDIAKYIFENNINSHIIITTGYKEFEYAQKAIEYKADFLLTKPFSYKELLDKIKSIKASIDIESHNAMREDKLYLNNWSNFKKHLSAVYRSEEKLDFSLFKQLFYEPVELESYKCYEITYNCSEQNQISFQSASDLGELLSPNEIYCFIENTDCTLCCVVLLNKQFNILNVINQFVSAVQLHFDCELEYSYLSFQNLSFWEEYCNNRNLLTEYFEILNNEGNKSALNFISNKLINLDKKELLSIYNHIIAFSDTDLFESGINYNSIDIDDIKNILENAYNTSFSGVSKSDHLISKVINYIEEHFNDPNLSLSQMASELNVNSNYLSQIIKKKTDLRFIDLLLKKRMETAKLLLLDTNLPIKEIAISVGYNQISYFRQIFKNYYGATPTVYRNKR